MKLDIKGQVQRGGVRSDWDQRKSSGEFEGASEGKHVATVVEFRADENTADLLTNPDRLAELVKPGDTALSVVNRIMDMVTDAQPDAFGQAASLLRLGGSGPIDFHFNAYEPD